MLKFIFKNELTIALIAAILFIPFLGYVHLFDWDEINFAESAREMIASGNYFSVQINYQRFTEKPPLFFWLQVISMKTFGVNEFAARFPNAICGIITLLVLFRIGKKIFDKTFAQIWVMIYVGTLVTFLYFKSGIIDPWYNLFIFLAVYYFHLVCRKVPTNTVKNACFTGLFLGLAVLTKGPVAIIIAALSMLVFLLIKQFKIGVSLKTYCYIFVVAFMVCFAWFGVDLIKNGPNFMIEFTKRQIAIFSTSDADHGEPFFYHWWVLLVGCFPASIFFMKGMFVQTPNSNQQHFKTWMNILFWVTLILFSIVKTKIVHYSSLCWFPLTALAALFVYHSIKENKIQLHFILKVVLAMVGLLIATILTVLPFAMMQKNKWSYLIEDEFARANLKADLHWFWCDGLGGVLVLAGIIFYLFSSNVTKKFSVLFASVTLCCLFCSIIVTSKIEAISQRANIEFFEAIKNENCYAETYGYKSYAPYFYGKKIPPTQAEQKLKDSILYGNSNQRDTITSFMKETRWKDWLLHGKIDKPVYFSTKIQNKQELEFLPQLQLLYEKNGFVFFKRMP